MRNHRSGTVQAANDARQEAIIRADEDGADILAPYAEMRASDGDTACLTVGERVAYAREEGPRGPIARDIRR